MIKIAKKTRETAYNLLEFVPETSTLNTQSLNHSVATMLFVYQA